MMNLFDTSSKTAGYRLQYIEILNWGTFDNEIFRINPQGNNSLLTGANGSGKTTYIDALLTLLVPEKRYRFYNQSSGTEKRAGRTEESYVLGHYGNIQNEGQSNVQKLRKDKNKTYSIILASFSNTNQRKITIFQVFWFSNGKLQKVFGLAHKTLEIETDFQPFDSSGYWKKRLSKEIFRNKKMVEFFKSPGDYSQRMVDLFGMRSKNALSLFNQIVGIKVLGNLDDFIRNNMLEKLDSEKEYFKLKENFEQLTNASKNIDKAQKQEELLIPIDKLATEIKEIYKNIIETKKIRDTAVFWFAEKGSELTNIEKNLIEENKNIATGNLEEIKAKIEELQNTANSLAVQIESDEVGKQIQEIKKEIKRLEGQKKTRSDKLDEFNIIASELAYEINPEETLFYQIREKAKEDRKKEVQNYLDLEDEIRLLKNKKDDINTDSKNAVDTIKSLQKHKNNIPQRTLAVREKILEHFNLKKEELPFVGELIKVKDDETEWQAVIEKLLHNFALQLIVPQKYLKQITEYVNENNLQWILVYQPYKQTASLANMQAIKNSLYAKLEFNKKSKFIDWVENEITTSYNYICNNDLSLMRKYPKVITQNGLIKSNGERYTKDDRPKILNKSNYVLGWDNKEKIELWKIKLKSLQKDLEEEQSNLSKTKKEKQISENKKDKYRDLYTKFKKFDEINWEKYALEISNKTTQKEELESANDKVKALEEQLKKVNTEKLKFETERDSKITEIANFNTLIANLIIKISDFDKIMNKFPSEYDKQNLYKNLLSNHTELEQISFKAFASIQKAFKDNIKEKLDNYDTENQQKETELNKKIIKFKNPDEETTPQYRDWRSETRKLPETIEFVSEYQNFLTKLQKDNLPKFQKKFDELIADTITQGVYHYRIFFDNWQANIEKNIELLNLSLKEIKFKIQPEISYLQLRFPKKRNEKVLEFKNLLDNSIPDFSDFNRNVEQKKIHYKKHIKPLIEKLTDETWRKEISDVRSWFSYFATEHYKDTDAQFNSYKEMDTLSGGEKAQLTYTILGSAIAYQFGLTQSGLESKSFRFIAIDESFSNQDDDKAQFLIDLCKQLHLQLLAVTPSDKIHIVEPNISFVHFVERRNNRNSILYDMPIKQFQDNRNKYLNT